MSPDCIDLLPVILVGHDSNLIPLASITEKISFKISMLAAFLNPWLIYLFLLDRDCNTYLESVMILNTNPSLVKFIAFRASSTAVNSIALLVVSTAQPDNSLLNLVCPSIVKKVPQPPVPAPTLQLPSV